MNSTTLRTRLLLAVLIGAAVMVVASHQTAGATTTIDRTVSVSRGRHLATAPAIRQAEGQGTNPADVNLRKEASLAGYLAYCLMVASMAFGILTTTGWVRKSIKRTTIYGGHMILAVTTLAFTAMHAISYALQSSGALSPAQIVIPFMGEAEVAVGIISFELMAAAAASVWLQRRFGYRRWQMFHWITYVAFGLGIGHVVATSSEVTQGPLAVGFFGIALVVVALAVMRSLPTTTLGRERIAVLEP